MKKSIVLLLSLSLLIFSCSKDYDRAIGDLVIRVTYLDSVIYATQNAVATVLVKVNSMKTVKEVRRSESGLTLVLSDNTEYIFSSGSGVVGTQWSIGDPGGKRYGDSRDSVWYLNGVATEYVAIPVAGVVTPVRSPGIVDGYWVTYEWDAALGDFISHRTSYRVTGDYVSYVTDDPLDASLYILHIRVGVDGLEFTEISLPKSGIVPVTPVAPVDPVTPADPVVSGVLGLHGYITYPSAGLSVGSFASSPTYLLSQSSFLDTLTILYRHLSTLYDVESSSSLPSWSTPLRHVTPLQLLTPLRRLGGYLVITLEGSTGGSLALCNSRGEEMPLLLGEPIELKGLLTRSIAGSSVDVSWLSALESSSIAGGDIYLVPVECSESTYANASSAMSLFRDRFTAGAVYHLMSGSGLRSNYSSFTINVIPHTSIVPEVRTTGLMNSSGVLTPIIDGACTIAVDKFYSFDFGASRDYIYDYEILNSSSSSSIIIDSSTGSFTLPSASNASPSSQPHTITLRKLHFDGRIHTETLSFTVQ